MSVWNQTKCLPNDVVLLLKQQYSEIFPLEVRHHLAQWLEDQLVPLLGIQPEFDPANYEQLAVHFLSAFVNQLEKGVPETENVTVQLCFMETARKLQQRFTHNPTLLLMHLTRCLQYEVNLINGRQIPYQNAEIMEINDKLERITMKVAMNDEANRALKCDYERFSLEYHDLMKNMAYAKTLTNPQELDMKSAHVNEQQKRLNDFLNAIQNKKFQLITDIKESIDMMGQAHELIMVKQLRQWKINQGLAGNGSPFHNNLDVIQQWCEKLAENLWSTKTQMQILSKSRQQLNLPGEANGAPDLLEPAKKEMTNLLVKLVTASFVIEKQPPQVMKTNTRFTATVRLLTGSKLNIQMNNPVVKVTIISETQAQLVQNTNHYTDQTTSGEILNNMGNLEFQSTTNQLSASFRNMQLKKIKRAEKKGTESVMDEKFALLFQSKFSIGSGELIITVWALSLPVVVIVHGNQEPQSWATITWDNAFADPSRVPFQVPDKVPWVRLAEALSMKFKHATGRELTEDNMQFLCEKVFRHPTPNTLNQNEMFITWAQFCKEPLPDRTYTFWDWFYAVMKLTREHLRNPWNEQLIMGFVHKRSAEDMLLKCPRGTFLLRYSDSELGGITIAWVDGTDGLDQQPQILMLQPFLAKDFAIRSLPDHIQDLAQLTTLYPNTPKEKAFGKLYTLYPQDQSNASTGYVRRVMVTQVPGMQTHPSYPNTPQHSMLSPDHSRDTPIHSGMNYGPPTIQNNQGMQMADWPPLDTMQMPDDFECVFDGPGFPVND